MDMDTVLTDPVVGDSFTGAVVTAALTSEPSVMYCGDGSHSRQQKLVGLISGYRYSFPLQKQISAVGKKYVVLQI